MIEIAARTDRLNTHRALALSIYDAGPVHDEGLRVAIESAETIEEIAGLVTGRDPKATRRRRSRVIEGQLSFDFEGEDVVVEPARTGSAAIADPSMLSAGTQVSTIESDDVDGPMPCAGEKRESQPVDQPGGIVEQADSGASSSMHIGKDNRNIRLSYTSTAVNQTEPVSFPGRTHASIGSEENSHGNSPLLSEISARPGAGRPSRPRMSLGP